jgi:hypothetical protein
MNIVPRSGEVEARRGIYLFCIASKDAVAGVSVLATDTHREIATLEYRDVIAIHAAVDMDDFVGPRAVRRLGRPDWVVPRAWRHEEIVEQVMAISPVMPARFGTIFPSSQALQDALARHYEDIKGFLDYVLEREEWAVKGWASTSASAAAQRPGAATREAEEDEATPYTRGAEPQAAAEGTGRPWSHERGRAISMRLQSEGVNFCARKTRPHDRPRRTEEMVFNWAFLLKREQREPFLDQVSEMNLAQASSGISLEATGPWPPYSFCPVIRDMQAELGEAEAA